VVFVIGLALVSVSKMSYDVALGAWIADRVPFARRSRVIGLTEIAWSAGLLGGVSVLALIVAASSWHVAYFVVAVMVLTAAGAVHRRLPHEQAGTQHTHGRTVAVVGSAHTSWRTVALTAISLGALAGSSQFLFVTFGSWLEDHFGFGAVGLAAVTFGLGALELVSSLVSVGHTDRWGKERCVMLGTAMMLPAALLVAFGSHHLPLLLIGLGVFLMGFELAIISGMPLGAELTPDAPAKGIGMLIGAITLMRASVSIPATSWFAAHGMSWPAIGAAGLSIVAGGTIALRPRSSSQPATSRPEGPGRPPLLSDSRS
jgi:predicted MFS family arabinose efflux permease